MRLDTQATMTSSVHNEPPENYAAYTTRLNADTDKLGWALRDKKKDLAKKLLADCMRHLVRLNEYLSK